MAGRRNVKPMNTTPSTIAEYNKDIGKHLKILPNHCLNIHKIQV